MEFPLISVIVPAYNAEQWIEECCFSVLTQTYPCCELIVVDDGSTDATGSILKEISKRYANVSVIHTENRGVCHARNVGLDASTGEYITFLDADDLLLPESLQFLHELLQEADADIAIGQKISVKASGEEVIGHFPKSYELWVGRDAIIRSLEDHPATYSVWGKLYKRKFVDDIRFVVGRRVHEDSFYIFQCMLKQPRVVVSDTCVLRYRITQNSASRSAVSDKLLDILYFAEEKKRIIAECCPDLIPLTINLEIKANMTLLHNLGGTYNKKYRELEARCLRTIQENRKAFQAATPWDEHWFWILTHHLYKPYKILFYAKRQARKYVLWAMKAIK